MHSVCCWGRLSCNLWISGHYCYSKCTLYVGFAKRPKANISHVMRSMVRNNLIIVDCAMGWILATILVDTPIPAVTRQYRMDQPCHEGGSLHLTSAGGRQRARRFRPSLLAPPVKMIRSVRAVIWRNIVRLSSTTPSNISTSSYHFTVPSFFWHFDN